eukprot:gnl/TRDRNA2_/TRDRNA2_191258_c0_seq1.p1 gnl/TRDRNA2_/TRDRNA2_191258_c0~~gnl/TRDRNA2_/TRDRNA2_191258_c0_seq1.p1  ORF type:complete len:1003 (+),score=230.68 gnl/TRDRNA2_/TRDRNA2_191258_c0_seq1:45-3053(+)
MLSKAAFREMPAMRAVGARMARLAGQKQGKNLMVIVRPKSAMSGVSTATSEIFLPSDDFTGRHLGPSVKDMEEMCKTIGTTDLDTLMAETIPEQVRREPNMELPDGRSLGEAGSLELIKGIVSKNIIAKNFIGMGYHGSIVPGVVSRNLLENPGWYTAYTPYQAEISQGRLESLVNFQTMVCELTGMEASNSSLLDEGTAGAEAMAMIARTVSKTKNQFFISDKVHPQTIEVMQTRAKFFGMQLTVGDVNTINLASLPNLAGALVQYPDTTGALEDFSPFSAKVKASGAHFVVATDPLALCLCKPPSEFGADIVIGSTQRFGVPMWFGGPSAAFMATSLKQVRRMPGRLIGESLDRLGNPAYRLTLQTREQHIRLDKATSNVCTAQVLLANMAAMYGVYHKTDGLKVIAKKVQGLAQLFSSELGKIGVEVSSAPFWGTVAFDVAPASPAEVVEILQAQGLNLRAFDHTTVTASFDESHSEDDIKELVAAIAGAGVGGGKPTAAASMAIDGKVSPAFARTSKFMEQDIFNTIHSETEMMRYMTKLQKKDLSLDTSMISLGSCTMKLNSVSSLAPCSWPEVANMHPFAPVSQTKGYRELLHSLERYLISITGFDACSLQPTSGASGEYAGLLTIRKYQESIGQGHRNVCIIPRSAHGTNPATAAMTGMTIKWIDDSKGTPLEEFRTLCEQHKEDLSCLMVTYPSTRAFFEENIQEICEIVHQCGGQVYMDGANMNAQLGLTSPGMIGADVCHLNLHKTFSIPHGGGGPGMGPICCRKHLQPYLPGHSIVQPMSGGSLSAVSAAPYGQAGIAAIPWMFITMLGSKGVTDSAKVAILNANYMKAKLAPYYDIVATNKNNRCSHEFIIDISKVKPKTGVSEEDIAKRLQDYGFHAPTMSWPVPHSLMVEPTESEDKAELDRFCEAMILIHKEIKKIESGEWPQDDNPLKMAPHTQFEVCATEWTHPYSREEAAFPAPWVEKRGKFWPTVARVDNSLGDRKLKLRLSA